MIFCNNFARGFTNIVATCDVLVFLGCVGFLGCYESRMRCGFYDGIMPPVGPTDAWFVTSLQDDSKTWPQTGGHVLHQTSFTTLRPFFVRIGWFETTTYGMSYFP